MHFICTYFPRVKLFTHLKFKRVKKKQRAAAGVKKTMNFRFLSLDPAVSCASQQVHPSWHQHQFKWLPLRLKSTMKTIAIVSSMWKPAMSLQSLAMESSDPLGVYWPNWTEMAVVLVATLAVFWVVRRC